MKALQKILSVITLYLLSSYFIFFGLFKALAYEKVPVKIPIVCSEFSNDGTFLYEIKMQPENEDFPAPNSDTLKISENSIGYFEITITEPGTFHYQIYEFSGTDKNIHYDGSVYDVTLFAENDLNDKLICSVIARISDKEGKTGQIIFENSFLIDKDIRTTEEFADKEDHPADTPSQKETKIEETVQETDTMETETSETVSTEISVTETFLDTTNFSDVSEVKNTSVPAENHSREIKNNTITEYIGSVLTQDGFPVGAVILVMASAGLTAISTFLFKREKSEEEDKNDE